MKKVKGKATVDNSIFKVGKKQGEGWGMNNNQILGLLSVSLLHYILQSLERLYPHIKHKHTHTLFLSLFPMASKCQIFTFTPQEFSEL